jgi:hypothetical protein
MCLDETALLVSGASTETLVMLYRFVPGLYARRPHPGQRRTTVIEKFIRAAF